MGGKSEVKPSATDSPFANLKAMMEAGKTLHRIEEAFLIAEVRRAGFALDAEGAFMRSAGDTREGPSNQATPPSDRFVLRFVKP